MISQIVFLLLTLTALGAFAWQMRKVLANIRLGRPLQRTDQMVQRLGKMLLVAFGQQKMFKRITPAVLHAFIYVSFLVINIEVLEIIIDGLTGQHRVLGQHLGAFYDGLMAVNEWLAVLVIVACVALLYRRNVMKVRRFRGIEMQQSKGLIRRRNYSHLDANIILVTEIVLMLALFLFNIADISLHRMGAGALGGELPGSYPISHMLAEAGVLGSSASSLHLLERIGWWGHILGIFAFLNYLPISKHFHILMAFPNVYFSKLEPTGKLSSPKHIQEEVKAAFDFSYTPAEDPHAPKRFGARDVTDLSWKSLLDAYTCTECGRCTSECPANLTGKKLSPRKIVMDVRDRLEEIQKFHLTTDENGVIVAPEGAKPEAQQAAAHTLLGDFYISEEELRACTTCNACVETCPVNIDQVAIIMELRRYLVMEESSMPEEWVAMSNNIENNGAPWAFPAAARFDWAKEV
ncbi:MAG: (Fe-S)-binding protein [Bacteroidetes bacterium]|nr:MAG: (Fe-S)-binding protein [Bacteroidota bacterium]